MSRTKIRKALESAVAAITPTVATAWENVPFTIPAATLPYQRVSVDFAEPRNTEFGPVYQERGYLQVALVYPAGKGTADVEARASILRAAFARGTTLTADGQVVTVSLTPNILPGFNDDEGRYVLTVRVPFFAQITN